MWPQAMRRGDDGLGLAPPKGIGTKGPTVASNLPQVLLWHGQLSSISAPLAGYPGASELASMPSKLMRKLSRRST